MLRAYFICVVCGVGINLAIGMREGFKGEQQTFSIHREFMGLKGRNIEVEKCSVKGFSFLNYIRSPSHVLRNE